MKHKEQGNPWMFVSLFLGALLVASFVTNIYVISTVSDLRVQGGTGTAVVPTAPAAPSAPSAPQRVEVSAEGAPSLGDPNAPVTIVEFSDFECPFCARFFTDSYPQIKANYIDTGKARLVYKHLPLPFHPNAQPAAEASMCANDQGKFWEYHDKIFQNQQSLTTANLKQWAVDLGLNAATFNSCFDSGKHRDYVNADLSAASAAGISGTPSFVINGQLVVGAQPYAAFQQAIDAALAAS